MPLIECPDCKKQISDAAPTCPGCGRPMQPPAAPLPFGAAGTGVMPPGGPKPLLIEQTSKRLKLQEALSIGAFLVGTVAFIPLLIADYTTPAIMAAVVGGGGLLWFIYIRVMIWWRHG